MIDIFFDHLAPSKLYLNHISLLISISFQTDCMFMYLSCITISLPCIDNKITLTMLFFSQASIWHALHHYAYKDAIFLAERLYSEGKKPLSATEIDTVCFNREI